MLLSCLESQGCHLIPLSYLLPCFFCLVLLLFLSCHFSDNGLFSWLFSRKLKYCLLRVRLFCMALVEQLGDDGRWYVQLAAILHWCLPLCIYVTFLNFILCLSIPFLYFSLTWYRSLRRNGRWYQHVLALCALLTGVILKGLTLRKFVSDVWVFMFYVCEVIGFVDWLDRGLIYMWEEFRNVHLLMTWVWLSWGDPVWLTGH